ncbi:MAG: hypothetical protein ACXU9O_14885 [Gemmatimonadaceae bacterium]
MQHFRRRVAMLFAAAGGLALACSSPIDAPARVVPDGHSLRAAAGTAPTVTAALPNEAPQDTTLDVQITGSGFDAGSHASFELQGVVDSRVHVNTTRYLKSTAVVANVTIARDAIVTQYDVAVTTASGKKGIGTDAFTVQQHSALPAWTIDATQSVNFASDGRGDYVSGQCGIQGSIFYDNYDPATGIGGDVTLDNIAASGSPGCAPRKITATLNGVPLNVPFLAIRTIVNLAVGASRTQNFVAQVDGNTKSCTRLGWWTVAEGGAGGQIVLTRTASDTWTATTTGPARCFYFKGQTRIWGTTFTNVIASFVIKQLP